MAGRVGAIVRSFRLSGRGTVVTLDIGMALVPVDLRLRIGAPLELRSPAGCWPTELRGIEMASPPRPDRPLALYLPADLTDEQLAPGTEVWTTP